MRLIDYLPDEVLADLEGAPGEALGLPGRAYGGEFYQLEQHSLFPRTWCAVGFGGDIPGPGDVMPVELAGWPLLLVRDTHGEVRAFHNVCRHRSMRVVSETCRGLSRLACPWHGWTYDLEGRLCSTPRIGGQRAHTDPSFDTETLGLASVPVAEWLDFIFVNLDGNAPSFAEHIQPLARLLDGYDLSDLNIGNGWSIDFDGNWKLVVEGAIEDYHLPHLHPQFVTGVADARPRLDHAPGCYFANSSARDYESVEASGELVVFADGLPCILNENGGDEPRTFVISVFPTGFITTRTNYLWQWLILPRGARQTRVDTRHYYRNAAATDPRLEPVRQRLVAEWRLVLEQDDPYIRTLQGNYDRPGEAGIRTRFSPYWEANVRHFQQSVVQVLRAAETE